MENSSKNKLDPQETITQQIPKLGENIENAIKITSAEAGVFYEIIDTRLQLGKKHNILVGTHRDGTTYHITRDSQDSKNLMIEIMDEQQEPLYSVKLLPNGTLQLMAKYYNHQNASESTPQEWQPLVNNIIKKYL